MRAGRSVVRGPRSQVTGAFACRPSSGRGACTITAGCGLLWARSSISALSYFPAATAWASIAHSRDEVHRDRPIAEAGFYGEPSPSIATSTAPRRLCRVHSRHNDGDSRAWSSAAGGTRAEPPLLGRAAQCWLTGGTWIWLLRWQSCRSNHAGTQRGASWPQQLVGDRRNFFPEPPRSTEFFSGNR
jgi:hypothetical protein